MAQENYLKYVDRVDFPSNLRDDAFWKKTSEQQSQMVEAWILGQMETDTNKQLATWSQDWYTCIWDVFHGCNEVWFYNNVPNNSIKASLSNESRWQIMFVGSNNLQDLIPKADRTLQIGNLR